VHNHLKKTILIILLINKVLFLTACNKKEHLGSIARVIQFELYYENQVLDCENLFNLPVELSEFRFYLHDFKLADSKVNFLNTDWQFDNIVLLDFVTSKVACDSIATGKFNQEIFFHYSQVDGYKDLEFTLGVPQKYNHQNPVKANAPLNRSDMHWQWLSGYKFLRLEYLNNHVLNRFHLGSVACSGKIPDAVNCKYPNRLKIKIKDFNLDTSIIEVHLDSLLDKNSEDLCMGDPEDLICKDWINGLEHQVFKSSHLR